jgi:ribosomal protein L31
MSNDVFITKSTADTRETLTVDGVDNSSKMEISRTSHPFTQVNLNLLILQDVLINSN